jgi:hypothetical protein
MPGGPLLATTDPVRRACCIGLLLALAACGPPCALPAAVSQPDGGVARCVQSQDCPRPAGVLLCASTEDHLRGCLACEATACVRYTPGTCR